MGRFTLATLLAYQPVAAMAHQHATLRQGTRPLAVGVARNDRGRAWLARQWVRRGSCWVYAANTGKNDGPDLVNLGANPPFGKRMERVGSMGNPFDEQVAETVDGSGSAPTYTAGLPRSPVLGLRAKW